MKVRMSFVSNSSSCSYCIYGVKFWDEEEVWKQIIDEKVKETIDAAKQLNDQHWAEEHDESLNHYFIVEDIVPKMFPGFEVDYGQNDERIIGRSWKNIKDDETGADFKASVERVIKKVFGDTVHIGTYEDGWFDG